ncbi:MAG TPA: metalloregulator ArsR/SmtB family transcription factor [Allosphingosinicella sp.]|jgi:DNA-binding transcriptional ArsR family regulator
MSAAEPAAVFAALADPTRLSLVRTLSAGEARSIASLSLNARVTRQAVTKHLRVLERTGLVRSARRGRETRFALRPEAMAPARAYLDTVAAQWEAALGRLKALVELPPSPGERGRG